jgi:diguanylate cyclase (GGDEF)-like protein
MGEYDKLTGLYNRRGFIANVEQLLKADSTKRHLIIYFDIRNFKLVNAVFGHRAGDGLLKDIANMLQDNMTEESVSCRLNSDRFCVFVPEERGQDIVDLLLKTDFHIEGDDTGSVHINVGIYEVGDLTMSVMDMCDRARMALDTIRENRLTNVAIYDASMYDELMAEHELSTELPAALKEGQLKLYLQPQVNADGELLGAETLLRWEHPKRGMLMPGEFLPFFEKNYMIVQIDKYIWELACKQLKQWKDEGWDNIYLSINISPSDFECIDVYEVLNDLVKKYKVEKNKLRVEITETTIMQNPQRQIKLIGMLRMAGFYVEMDDFGSGYSSFSMLKDIQIDALKLDMKFLRKSKNEEKGKKILKSLVELANDFGMRVIAEGVETQDQIEFLKKIGCGIFQGYYFSRPMTVERFEEKYKQKRIGA